MIQNKRKEIESCCLMNKMKIIGLAQTEFLGVFQTHFTI